MRLVSTRVLPEPAPATMSSGEPAWVTAARWASLRPASRASEPAPGAGRGAGRAGADGGLGSGGSKRVGIAVRVYSGTPTSARGRGRGRPSTWVGTPGG